MVLVRVVRPGEADEVGGHDVRALVEQLVEGVLPVRARLAPHDRAGVAVDRRAVELDALAVRLHVELLQVGREARQLLRVRQDRLRLASEHGGVQGADHARARSGRCSQVAPTRSAVDDVEAVQELAELLRTDVDHQRQPDRRVDRVAPADPVPEPEHVGGVDPELGHPLGVGRHGDEVIADGVLAERVDQPTPRGAGVGQRLDRAERLGGDDEQRRRRIECLQRGVDVGAVDVRHEVGAQARMPEGGQRTRRHRRPEVGAADADVDDVGDAVVGADAIGERRHRVEHGVHVRHDVVAVDLDHRVARARAARRAAPGDPR